MAKKKGSKDTKKRKTMRQIGRDSMNAIQRNKRRKQQLMKELFGKRQRKRRKTRKA